MRSWLFAVGLVGAAQCAQAGELSDFLRGGFSEPAVRTNWAGPYIGGQVTHGAADMDFAQTSQDLIARLLNHSGFEVNKDTSGDSANDTRVSRWRFLKETTQQSSGVGGFAGYNFQMEDVVYGVEFNYTHGKFSGRSSGSKSQYDTITVPDYIAQLTAVGTSSMTVRDFGSLRARAGYALDNFLPYAFAGVALGQADIGRTVSVDIKYAPAKVPQTVPSLPSFSDSLSDSAGSHFIYGWSAGLGFEYMLYRGLFVRGEWEYLRFMAAVDTSINTVRAGVGYTRAAGLAH